MYTSHVLYMCVCSNPFMSRVRELLFMLTWCFIVSTSSGARRSTAQQIGKKDALTN